MLIITHLVLVPTVRAADSQVGVPNPCKLPPVTGDEDSDLTGAPNATPLPAITDPTSEQLILFIAKPSTFKHQPLWVVPVNQDLLYSYAFQAHHPVEQYVDKKLDPPHIRIHRIATVQRFNDPLKSGKPGISVRVPAEALVPSIPPVSPGSDPAIKIWQSKDGKRIAHKLDELIGNDGHIKYIDPHLVTDLMASKSIVHAHFRRVPTKFDAGQANPGNFAPDIRGFPPSDIHSPAH